MIDNELLLALPFLGIWARTVGYPAGAMIFEESLFMPIPSHTGFVATEATASDSRKTFGLVRG